MRTALVILFSGDVTLICAAKDITETASDIVTGFKIAIRFYIEKNLKDTDQNETMKWDGILHQPRHRKNYEWMLLSFRSAFGGYKRGFPNQ